MLRLCGGSDPRISEIAQSVKIPAAIHSAEPLGCPHSGAGRKCIRGGEDLRKGKPLAGAPWHGFPDTLGLGSLFVYCIPIALCVQNETKLLEDDGKIRMVR